MKQKKLQIRLLLILIKLLTPRQIELLVQLLISHPLRLQ
nr:MAG TPA: protein of unknown function (DUF4248) [Caudoviricetes sp.]